MEVRRHGVSGYIEVFLLIGVAIGGCGIALDSTMMYASSAQGPSLLVTGGTIRQGSYLAVEKFLVSDTGQTALGSLTVATQPVSKTAEYCYSLLDPATMKVLYSTCPMMVSNPSSLVFASGLSPGESLLVELFVTGPAFAPGSSCTVTVSDATGTQQSLALEVVPA